MRRPKDHAHVALPEIELSSSAVAEFETPIRRSVSSSLASMLPRVTLQRRIANRPAHWCPATRPSSPTPPPPPPLLLPPRGRCPWWLGLLRRPNAALIARSAEYLWEYDAWPAVRRSCVYVCVHARVYVCWGGPNRRVHSSARVCFAWNLHMPLRRYIPVDTACGLALD
jgi:hypothetical protein